MTKSEKRGLILGTLSILFAVLAAVTLILSVTANATEAKSLQEVYDNAVKQYNAGQYEDALAGFELVLKKQPRYVYARNYAVKCRTAIAQGKKPVIDLEKQLAAIRIPSVEFDKTDLGTALEFLTQKTEELSGGKVSANIVYQGTEEDRKNKLVTFKLRNVPVSEVLTYVGRQTGTTFKYEKYAIVGTPVRASAVAVQPAPAVQEAAGKKFDTFTNPPPADPFKKK